MCSIRSLRRTRRALAVGFSTFTLACGGAPAARGSGLDRAAPPPTRAEATAPATAVDRRVRLDTPFDEVMRRAQALADDESGVAQPWPDSPCILRRHGDSWHFDAVAVPASSPLPPAATDLPARLRANPGTVAVMTAYGIVGDASSPLVAVTFTDVGLPQPHEVRVLFVTERGVAVRSTHDASDTADVVPFESAASILRVSSTLPTVVVGEADASIGALLALASHLGTDPATVALATLLPEGTRLPSASRDPRRGVCGESPPDPADVSPVDRPADELTAPIVALRETLAGCASANGSFGRRVHVSFRVEASGSISGACVRAEDDHGAALDAGTPELRDCVLEALRSATFEPAHGFTDVELPLEFSASETRARSRFACEDRPRER